VYITYQLATPAKMVHDASGRRDPMLKTTGLKTAKTKHKTT